LHDPKTPVIVEKEPVSAAEVDDVLKDWLRVQQELPFFRTYDPKTPVIVEKEQVGAAEVDDVLKGATVLPYW
jgi:hypothetical protein